MVCTLLTPRVRRWLRHGRPARVLHLFDQVCNLVNDQGDVISLASPAVGPGPFTMILPADFPNYLSAIRLSDPIHVDTAAQTMNIGPLRVETSQAGIWDPIPEWSRLRHGQQTNWPEARPLSPTPGNQLAAIAASTHQRRYRSDSSRDPCPGWAWRRPDAIW